MTIRPNKQREESLELGSREEVVYSPKLTSWGEASFNFYKGYDGHLKSTISQFWSKSIQPNYEFRNKICQMVSDITANLRTTEGKLNKEVDGIRESIQT